jgi:integrase/recombinase XerD
VDRRTLTLTTPQTPTLVERAGNGARFAFDEFLSGINSPHTARAYASAVGRFLAHAHRSGLELHQILPGFIADYIRTLPLLASGEPGRVASRPTRKLHLAAIRLFLDHCVQRHAILLNPALSVRGPRHSVEEGKTPAIDAGHARKLLDSINADRPIDRRDRAIIATLIFTAARVGAVSRLTRGDLFSDGRQRYFRFHEKGDKQRVIPLRHDLDEMLDAYWSVCPPGAATDPLFLSAAGRTGRLTGGGMTANDMLRMVKRRLRAAGLHGADWCCHSFRAGTATNLLEQGVDPAEVQYLLGHSDPRTTRLYDRRQLRVSRNIVERIAV